MKTFLSAAKPVRAILPVLLFQLVARAAGPIAPDAGAILQQVQPASPVATPPSNARLMLERTGGDMLPASASFPVKSIRIAGNTRFDTATLHALVAEAEGKTLTLPQLGEWVARITAYYHAHGYPLAQALILAQVIQDGVLVIDVVEARYGAITVNNLSRVDGGLLEDTLSPLASGQPIEESSLSRTLGLLSEIPGVVVNATLKPGDAAGTSDLQVNATRGRAYSGSAMLDNYGTRSTGKLRLSATANVFNPFHHGDILSVSGLSSGKGANHGRVTYESLVSGQGTRVGAAYSTLHYILGEPFAALHAHGTAQLASFWAKTPLQRSQRFNFSGQVQFDALQLRDHIDAGAVRTDRHLGNATVSITGDVRDSFLSGGMTTASLGGKTGRVAFDDPAAQSTDAATAGTAGGFAKINLNLGRWQRLTATSGLYLAFAGQWANGNLDSSEKMTAGGPSTVRAYDVGAVSGDSGYFGTAEVRQDLGNALNTQWQAVAFVDHAELGLNRVAWVNSANRVRLSGAGVGLNFSAAKTWSARISVAARLGSAPAAVTRAATTRLWIELSRAF